MTGNGSPFVPYQPNGHISALPQPAPGFTVNGQHYPEGVPTPEEMASLTREDHLVIEELVGNAIASRQEWIRGVMADPRRNLNKECGFPEPGRVSDQVYANLYERDPLAARVVQVMARESWQVSPLVYETEDAEQVTEWERAWDELGRQLRAETSYHAQEQGSLIWKYLEDADVLSGIDHYAIILLGLDDGRPLHEPVEGWEEFFSVPVESPGRKKRGGAGKSGNANGPEFADTTQTTYGTWGGGGDPGPAVYNSRDEAAINDSHARNLLVLNGQDPAAALPSAVPSPETPPPVGPYSLTVNARKTKGRKLLYMSVFPETLAPVATYESNPSSPRFMQPTTYDVTFNDPRTSGGGVSASQFSMTRQVHWTRVVHVADTHHQATSSKVFAFPRMEPVLNVLLSAQKVWSAGAEGYWQSCFTTLSFETHPQLGGDVKMDKAKLKAMMYEVRNRLQRDVFTSGMAVKSIAPSVVDMTPFVETLINLICIKLGIPVRIFKGSERGELASTQDDAAWNDRVKQRQQSYLTPCVVVPVIDRLINVGVLPKPKAKLSKPEAVASKEGENAAEPVPEAEVEEGVKEKEAVANAADQPRDELGRWASVSSSAGSDPGFKKWFGKSKAKDKDGNPLVLYHGATQQFDAFATGATYFTDKVEVAQSFAESRAKHAGEDNPVPRLIAVHVKIEKPFVIDAKGEKAGNIQFDSFDRYGYKKALTSGKHDGVIVKNTRDEGTLYVTLKPDQVHQIGRPVPTANVGFPPKAPKPATNVPADQMTGDAAKAQGEAAPSKPAGRPMPPPEAEEEPGYKIEWPDITSQSKEEKAAYAAQMATALSTYAGPGAAPTIVAPFDFLTEFGELDESRVHAILENSEEHKAKQEADAQQKQKDAIEKGLVADPVKEQEAKIEALKSGKMMQPVPPGKAGAAGQPATGKPTPGFPAGRGPTLNTFNPNQPRDEDGKWTGASSHSMAAMNATRDIPDVKHLPGGLVIDALAEKKVSALREAERAARESRDGETWRSTVDHHVEAAKYHGWAVLDAENIIKMYRRDRRYNPDWTEELKKAETEMKKVKKAHETARELHEKAVSETHATFNEETPTPGFPAGRGPTLNTFDPNQKRDEQGRWVSSLSGLDDKAIGDKFKQIAQKHLGHGEAPEDIAPFTRRGVQVKINNRWVALDRYGDTVEVRFSQDGSFRSVAKDLQPDTLSFAKSLRALTKDYAEAGFKILSKPMDARRDELYNKTMTRLGMKPVGENLWGLTGNSVHVWNDTDWDWLDLITNTDQPRVPAGSPEGGQFAGKGGSKTVEEAAKIVLHPPGSVLAQLMFGDEKLELHDPNIKTITTKRGKEYKIDAYTYDLGSGRSRIVLSAGDPKTLVDAGAIVRTVPGKGVVVETIHKGETFDGLGGTLARFIVRRYGNIVPDPNSPLSEAGRRATEKLLKRQGEPIANGDRPRLGARLKAQEVTANDARIVLKDLTAYLHGLIDDVTLRDARNIARAVKLGTEEGMSDEQVANVLRKVLPEEDFNDYRCSLIATTEMTRARGELLLANAARAGESSVRFVAHPDCCDDCQRLNGREFSLKGVTANARTKPASGVIPVHPGCRCRWDRGADPLTGNAEQPRDELGRWTEIPSAPTLHPVVPDPDDVMGPGHVRFVVGQKGAKRFGEEATVKIGDLTATQTYLDPDKVREKLAGKDTDLPIVVDYKGRRYVGDGHHRIEADKLRGEKEIRAIVVPLDENKRPINPPKDPTTNTGGPKHEPAGSSKGGQFVSQGAGTPTKRDQPHPEKAKAPGEKPAEAPKTKADATPSVPKAASPAAGDKKFATPQDIEAGQKKAIKPGVDKVTTADGKSYAVKQRETAEAGGNAEKQVSDMAQIAGVNVPRTEKQTVNGKPAVVTEWAEGGDLKSMTPEARKKFLQSVPKEQIDKHTMFDYLLGHGDTHNGNFIAGADGAGNPSLVGIDKELWGHNGGHGKGTKFDIPQFVADVTGGYDTMHKFDRKHVEDMIAAGEKMATAPGISPKDAQGIRNRVAVLKKFAEKPDAELTTGELWSAGQRGVPSAGGFLGKMKGMFGGGPTGNAFDQSQPRDEQGRWVVYHGTADTHLKTIMERGIVPGEREGADALEVKTGGGNYKATFREEGRDKSVYLSTDASQASVYGAKAVKLHGSKPVVLEVRIPADQMVKDDEAGGSAKSKRFEGTIRPEWITGVLDVDFDRDELVRRVMRGAG